MFKVPQTGTNISNKKMYTYRRKITKSIRAIRLIYKRSKSKHLFEGQCSNSSKLESPFNYLLITDCSCIRNLNYLTQILILTCFMSSTLFWLGSPFCS